MRYSTKFIYSRSLYTLNNLSKINQSVNIVMKRFKDHPTIKLIANTMSSGFLCFYLSKRKKRPKINLSYSEFEELISRVHQDSILVPLLSNIYNLFFETEDLDISSYANNNTPSELNEVLPKLKIEVDEIFNWFQNNYFKLNSEKCHLLTTKSEVDIEILENLIKSENSTKLSGVNIEGRLNFDYHTQILSKKANKKLHVLSKKTTYEIIYSLPSFLIGH